MAMQRQYRPGGRPAVSDVEEAFKRIRQRRGEIPMDEEPAPEPAAAPAQAPAVDPLTEAFKQSALDHGYGSRTRGPGGVGGVGTGQLPVYQPGERMVMNPAQGLPKDTNQKPWWDGPAPSGLDPAKLREWMIRRNQFKAASAKYTAAASPDGESVTGAPAPEGAPAAAPRLSREEIMKQRDSLSRKGDEWLYLLQQKDREIERETDPQRKSLLRQERGEIAGKRHQYVTSASRLRDSLGEGPKVLDAAGNRAARAEIVGKELEVVRGQVAELLRTLRPEEMGAGRLAEGRKQLAAAGRYDLMKGANQKDADEFAQWLGRDFRGTMTEEERNQKLTQLMARRRELETQHKRLTATEGHWFNETMSEAEKSSAAQAKARDEWMERSGARQRDLVDAAGGLDERTAEPGFYQQSRQLADETNLSRQQAEVSANKAVARTADAQPQTAPEDDPKYRAKVSEYKSLALDVGLNKLRRELTSSGIPDTVARNADLALHLASQMAGRVPVEAKESQLRIFSGAVKSLKSAYATMDPAQRAEFQQTVRAALAQKSLSGKATKAADSLWTRIWTAIDPTYSGADADAARARAVSVDQLVNDLLALGTE
jgi:hypothetical protein